MKTNGGRSRDEILAEVESVRSDMDSTLSEIERKLTPGQLVDQGLEYLRGSGASEFVSNLGTSVKQNPVPVALVGVGIAWLMASGRSGSFSASAPSSGGSMRRATDQAWAGARDQAPHAGRTLGDAAQAARERLDQTRQAVSDAAQSAREGLDQARQAVSSTVQTARGAVSHGADVAQRQFERARSGYDWIVREQPLALGAIGLAVGALLAAAAPRSQIEDEWMGETSDRLTDRAKEAGREQLERAGEALKSAGLRGDGNGSRPGEHHESLSSGSGATLQAETPRDGDGLQKDEAASRAAGQAISQPGTAGFAPKQEWPGGRRPSE